MGWIGYRYVFATFQHNLIKDNILALKPKNDTIEAYSEVEFQKAQTRTIPTYEPPIGATSTLTITL